jgi:hypothetical protein
MKFVWAGVIAALTLHFTAGFAVSGASLPAQGAVTRWMNM